MYARVWPKSILRNNNKKKTIFWPEKKTIDQNKQNVKEEKFDLVKYIRSDNVSDDELYELSKKKKC